MAEGWDIEKAIQDIKGRCHGHKLDQSDVRGFDCDEKVSDDELSIDNELESGCDDNSRESFDVSEFVETEMIPSPSPRVMFPSRPRKTRCRVLVQQQQRRQKNKLQTQQALQPEQNQQQQTIEDLETKHNSDSQFYVGRDFTSYKDLCKAQQIYEHQKKIMLSRRSSQTIANDFKSGKRKNTNYNKDLKYAMITYQCRFGEPKIKKKKREFDKDGKPIKKRRFRPSQCTRCPFLLKLGLSKDSQALRVVKIHEEHNHVCSSSKYLRIPRMQLDKETLEETKILLALDVDIMKIQKYLCSKGKMVLNNGLHNLNRTVKAEKKKGKQSLYSKDKMFSMKDLQNLVMNEDNGNNSFEDVLALMMSHQDISFEIMMTKESVCQGVFFQTEDMKQIFDMSSEMMVFDTTYRLGENKMPLYFMLCLDGNGESVVIAVALAQYENKETVSWIAESFRKYNQNFTKVKYIMADKDILERQELLNHFPNAQLLNCQFFNTIKTFKKEVSTTKMNISLEEREFCLEMFLNIVFSEDKAICDSNITLLKDMAPENVVEYVTKKWEPIKDDWTKGVLSNKTISKLEFFNGKLKSLIESNSSMTKFVIDLLIVIHFNKWKRDQRASTHITSLKQ